MHERGLISQEAARLLEAWGDDPPTVVEISLGPEMDQPVVESTWQHVVAGTVLEDTALIWAAARHRLACFDCGAVYEGNMLDRCGCGGNGLAIESAPELTVPVPGRVS